MNGFHTSGQTQTVSSFQELVSTPFYGEVNALCWERKLEGDFSEITEKILTTGNITELSEQSLIGLSLTEQGNLAREKVLEDLRILKNMERQCFGLKKFMISHFFSFLLTFCLNFSVLDN